MSDLDRFALRNQLVVEEWLGGSLAGGYFVPQLGEPGSDPSSGRQSQRGVTSDPTRQELLAFAEGD
jgi:hypothetical protein